ncbi:hypothetical protein OF83DRAFT_1047997 [Amylostereum chailletii]|nr:hypothetical protein OF83DRAFT_1047997 [Amylostereum chailletii]
MAHQPATTTDPASLSTAYAVSLLTEYTHTLDALPIEISRSFAELHELDAVLSATVVSMTGKINRLTDMIENNTASKEERFWLLVEIAEDAQRLRPGGEDKIRVSSLAADALHDHHEHMSALLQHAPGFDDSLLIRRTVYPHVAPRSYAPVSTHEGRRRRGALLTSSSDPATSNKRKRPTKDDDGEPAGGRTPRKDRQNDAGGQARSKNGNRSRKTDRAASPTESVLSVTSHQQPHVAQPAQPAARTNGRSSGSAKKRNRGAASTPTETNGARDLPLGPPAATHPSLPTPFMAVTAPAWNGPVHPKLEGPGMPIARNIPIPLVGPGVAAPSVVEPVVQDADADADAEADDGKLYCWCNGPSFGDMIGCDDSDCEREWFHLSCLGLQVAPKDEWFCDGCKNKAKNKRRAPVKSRKSGGGRSGRGNTAS